MDKKILRVILILIIFIIILSCPIFAMTASQLEPIYTPNSTSFVRIGREMLGWVRNIAAVSLVVLLAFIGLRFMFGSLEQRAEYKKSLMPLLIGSFVVLGATTITSMVWNISKNCEHVLGICTSDVKCDSCGVQGPIGHEWGVLKTTMSYGYDCKYCSKSITISSYGTSCGGVNNQQHVFQIEYYGDYNDIKATCENCGLVRKSGE